MHELPPVLSTPRHAGGRSALTCRYRCGDACFPEIPNTSATAYAGDIIAGALSRRSVMRATAVVTVAAAVGATAIGPGTGQAEAAAAARPTSSRHGPADGAQDLRFTRSRPTRTTR